MIEELKELIKNNIENKKPFKKEKFLKYSNLIYSKTSWMKNNDSLYARCFCILNNIKTYPICECGNEITVFNANCTHNFNTFCSKLCASKSKTVSKKMSSTKYKKNYYINIKNERNKKLQNIIADEYIKEIPIDIFKKQFIKLVESSDYDFANIKNKLFSKLELCKTYEINFKDYSYSKLYYNFKNNIDNIPKCNICKIKNQNFISYQIGYSGFCSKSCGSIYMNKNKNERYEKNKNNIIRINNNDLKIKIEKCIKNNISNNFYDVIQSRLPELIGNIYKRTEYLSNNAKFNERIYQIINDLTCIPICNECNKTKLKFKTFTKGYGKYCLECVNKLSGIKTGINLKIKLRKKNYNKHVDNLINNNSICLTNKSDFIKTGVLKIKHLACGKIYKRKIAYLNGCPYCSKNGSTMEKDLSKFISYITNYEILLNRRKILGGLEIDIFIPDLNLGVEFNGMYYHSELSGGKEKSYHLKKTNLAQDKNIQLLHIFENEWVLKNKIIKSIILSKIGKYQKRIYARQCKVKEIDAKSKNIFLEENHLQGKDKSKHKIGLFYNEELISVMTFGRRKITGGESKTELIRFASKLNTQIIGGASKLFSYYLKNLHDGSKIVTYADRRYSNGNLYNKLGFKLKHISSPNYWYFLNTERYTLYHRVNFQKHKLKNKLETFDEKLTEWENMQNNGYDRIWDCGNYVFEYK